MKSVVDADNPVSSVEWKEFYVEKFYDGVTVSKSQT